MYVFINWKLCLLNMYIISFLSSHPHQSTCYLPTVVAIVHFLRVLSLMERQQYPFTQFWRYELTSVFFVLLDMCVELLSPRILPVYKKNMKAQLSLSFCLPLSYSSTGISFSHNNGMEGEVVSSRLMCMYNTITFHLSKKTL